VVQRDAFAVLAQPDQRKAKVRLEALLVEVEADERPADDVGEPGAGDRVDHRDPHHIARNAEARDLERARQRPQDGDERHQRHDRRQKPERKGERVLDEQAQIFRDALVGIVGALVEKRQAVMRLVPHPVDQEALGQPGAPLDLQHLLEVQAVDGRDDVQHRDQRELAELPEELGLVLVLQRVVEIVVPGVELHLDPHQRERQPDHHGEQREALAAFAGHPVRLRQCPESR